MRVLGVDPGLTRCGIGVVDGRPGRPPSLVHADVIRTPANADVAARLLALEEEIDTWLTEYRPDAVAGERVVSQHNVRAGMGTAQAGGGGGGGAGGGGGGGRGGGGGPQAPPGGGGGGGGRAGGGGKGPGPLRGWGPSRGGGPRRGPPIPPTRWRWPSAICGGAAHRTG